MVKFIVILLALVAITGCAAQGTESGSDLVAAADAPEAVAGIASSAGANEFTLETAIVDGRMGFVGRGGTIDGVVNPDLHVEAGATLLINVINQDGIPHDLSIPDFGAKTALVSGKDKVATLSLALDKEQSGTFAYFCTVLGHRQAGMEGRLIVQAKIDSLSAAGG